jgi:hypothetical protein
LQKTLPKNRRALEQVKKEFLRAASTTDWTKLRIEPLLEHVKFLERFLRSPKFARETSRLRMGVAMFHSDLVYLRENVKALKEILKIEGRFHLRRAKNPSNSFEPAGDRPSDLVGTVLLQEVEAFDDDAVLVREAARQFLDSAPDEYTGLRVDKQLRQRRCFQPCGVGGNSNVNIGRARRQSAFRVPRRCLPNEVIVTSF